MKKEPLRTCVITKEKLNKRELIRVVRTPEKNIIVDLSGRANGKGAYLKKDLEVINKAEKTKALERVLEISVPCEIYEELRKNI